MLKLYLNIITIIAIFTGCSSKQYFEPENTISSYGASIHSMPQYIRSLNKDGATLGDYRIINKDGISKFSLPNGYHFLNKIDQIVIASNRSGQLLLRNKKNILTFKKNVIAASLKGNLLALVFADNSIGVFDISTNKFKLKEYQEPSLVNDIRIANPIFLDDIILFPTLNGNLLIASNKTFKVIKTINIDPNSKINNVIFLSTIGNTMIAATSNKILSLGDDTFSLKDYNIKDIISHDQYIYVATLEGEILKLDLSLDKLVKKKFKFAKIHALGFGTQLYALESQDYLISLNDDFSEIKVYDFDFDETRKTIVIDDTLYFDDEYIELD